MNFRESCGKLKKNLHCEDFETSPNVIIINFLKDNDLKEGKKVMIIAVILISLRENRTKIRKSCGNSSHATESSSTTQPTAQIAKTIFCSATSNKFIQIRARFRIREFFPIWQYFYKVVQLLPSGFSLIKTINSTTMSNNLYRNPYLTLLAIAHSGRQNTIISCPMFVNFLSSLCNCLLYTSPSPRDGLLSRMPSSA